MRLLIASLLLIAASAFTATSASAAGPAEASQSSVPTEASAREFREAAAVIPKALLKQGYSQIGDLKFKALIKQIANVDVKPVEGIDHFQIVEGNPSERISAEWSNVSIRYNPTLWKQSPVEVQAVLALHENLGVAGFDDTKYQLSSGLWILSLSDNPMTAKEKADFATSLKKLAASGGGIVGVGGGGDGDSVESKLRFLLGELRLLKTSDHRDEQMRELTDYLQIFMQMEHDPATPCRFFLAQTKTMQAMAFEQVKDRFKSVDDMIKLCEKRVRGE